MSKIILDRVVEKLSGISADTLRKIPQGKIHAVATMLHGKTKYPPPLVSSEEANKQVSEAIK